jgi:hypothetical protein
MNSKVSPLLCAVVALALLPACSGQNAKEVKSSADTQAPAAPGSAPEKPLPRFADYPAGEKFTGKPVAPVLASAEARRYRTMIRQDAAAGPNFAGHYTIAQWGCGSTCIGFAIVNAKTGAVHFHPTISRAMQVPYQTDSVLQFHLDSRLLVIAGETEGPQGQSSTGKFYYEWKDDRFALIAEGEIQLEPGAPPLPPGMELDDLCSGIDNSLECAQEIERYQLKKPEIARRVKRSGGELILQLRGGRSLSVRDEQRPDDQAATVKYNFRDYLGKIGYFLIHRQFYEGSDYLMVHERTGSRYALHNVPVLSPDQQRLVTASDGVTGGYSPNAVQIWRLTQNGMEMEQTIEPQGWGPSDPKWTDNHTIRLTKKYPAAGPGEPRTESATLKRNGKWQLQ